MISAAEITGVILCGGEGKRFGGRAKPLLPLGGLPLVAHAHRALGSRVSRIIISANDHAAEYAPWGDVVLPDARKGLGPLGGLLTALDQIATPYAFCCPGDAPFLDGNLLVQLAKTLQRNNADLTYPVVDGHSQHLFLFMKSAVRDALRQYLADGGRAVRPWVDTLSPVAVHFPDKSEAFLNLNTPADYDGAVRMLAQAGSQ